MFMKCFRFMNRANNPISPLSYANCPYRITVSCSGRSMSNSFLIMSSDVLVSWVTAIMPGRLCPAGVPLSSPSNAACIIRFPPAACTLTKSTPSAASRFIAFAPLLECHVILDREKCGNFFFQRFKDGRSFLVKQLHADLHK